MRRHSTRVVCPGKEAVLVKEGHVGGRVVGSVERCRAEYYSKHDPDADKEYYKTPNTKNTTTVVARQKVNKPKPELCGNNRHGISVDTNFVQRYVSPFDPFNSI